MEVHPVLLCAAVVGVTVVIVGFTAPSSIFRLAAVPIIIICSLQCISTSIYYMVRVPWATSVAGYTITFLLHYFDIALLRGWSFETNGPTIDPATGQNIPKAVNNKRRKKGSILERLKFGLSATFSFRHIGTPYQVKNVPAFSDNNTTYIPTRSRFLLRSGFTFVAIYIVLDLLTFQVDTQLNRLFFTHQNIGFFRRTYEITTEEVMMRTFATIASALMMTCVQKGCYYLLAFLSVLFSISEPREWPPLYGSFSQAFSMRRVWAVFWHQTNASKFASISDFTLHRLLGLSRGTQLARYARLITIFTISAFMHFLIDVAAGVPVHHSGSLQFFLTQALGIVIEDLVTHTYRRSFIGDRSRPYYLVEKIVGFIWVGVFMVWSSPMYVYPMMYRINTGQEDSVIPFSIMKLLAQADWHRG
ncbi:TRI7 [Arthroderma uncinatum]|uniref:TRI7 n=1 Tax=Arthroderma uncinatum TaxID=74035 RepID=UPI00144A6E60|nr:TRI7 [Arthroderma uncinatum]KAF3481673.1 TRI7 [Arthroderma uncinatum]